MTQGDASKIQSAEAKHGGGGVEKGSFASQAQVLHLHDCFRIGITWFGCNCFLS